MAGGMFTKQAVFQTAKFLNDVNDPAGGPTVGSVPGGIAPQFVQDYPGDRICLDDATALALSDTAVGTLFGGIYEYVLTIAGSTASPAVGVPAFFRAADVGTAGVSYQVTPDANPTAAIPTFHQGVYINAITAGNQGWIQILGTVTVKYQAAVTATVAGNPVSVGISQSPPAYDSGVAAFATIGPALFVGVAVTAPANGALKTAIFTRFPGRI